MGRGRLYAFEALDVGDRLFVALNGRSPAAVTESVQLAARFHSRTRQAGFRVSVSIEPGFVVAERISDAAPGQSRRMRSVDRLQELLAAGRQRTLADEESDRLERLVRRVARAGRAA